MPSAEFWKIHGSWRCDDGVGKEDSPAKAIASGLGHSEWGGGVREMAGLDGRGLRLAWICPSSGPTTPVACAMDSWTRSELY